MRGGMQRRGNLPDRAAPPGFPGVIGHGLLGLLDQDLDLPIER